MLWEDLLVRKYHNRWQFNVVQFSLCVLEPEGFLKQAGAHFDAYVN